MWRRNLIPIISSYRYELLPPSLPLLSPQEPPAQPGSPVLRLFSPALLTVSRPVLKALAQTTVPVVNVLLTPADVAPTAATALLLVIGSYGLFTRFLRAPAVSSAVTSLSAIEAVTIELVVEFPVLIPLPAICRDGALRSRQCLRALLLPEKSVVLISYNTLNLSPVKISRVVL